jgi:hypothetical protein
MTNQQAGDQSAQYYRRRASEAREKAEAMRDPQARETMLQVARMWDAMAKTLEGHPDSN